MVELTSERLRAMVDTYHAARGLDPDGLPTAAAYADLHLTAALPDVRHEVR
jgi:hypothetical protein